MARFAIVVLSVAASCHAFAPAARPLRVTHTRRASAVMADVSFDGVLKGASIFAEKLSKGDDMKQALADGLAGEYDRAAADAEITRLVNSAPVVVFSWTMSPASKQAKELLKMAGASPVYKELNEPWEDGNPIRAELGRRTGRTSVPSVWIGGVYVGGCNDGPSLEAPGIVPLAFSGKLQEKLAAAASAAAVTVDAWSPAGDLDSPMTLD
mmetsp:Transcript_3479/g.8693  ORF Transcript_3479/g.8693 Transcript_3479/m.8693 type:complete len:210 (-) Transcript_3479:204-833(-)